MSKPKKCVYCGCKTDDPARVWDEDKQAAVKACNACAAKKLRKGA